jgi:hypothetical protein
VREISVRTQIALGTAALLILRAVLTLPRPGPVVLVDEVAYLTNARFLGGGAAAQLLTTPFYRGGYSLLIAPLVALPDDPVTAYHLVLIANAVLAAALFPLLYLLLTRIFRVSAQLAVWAALAAAAYPTLTTGTGAAMSENLLFPLTALWLLLFGIALEAAPGRARTLWAAAFGLSAAALWTVHGRMIVAVALSALALVVLLLRRQLDLRAGAAGLAALAAGGLAGKALNDHLATENYGARHFDEAGSRLSEVKNLDDVLTLAGNVVGQTWYLMVATLGVVLVLLADRERRAGFALAIRARAAAPDLVFTLLVLTTAGLVALSAVSFVDIERADMLIYGRYTEIVAPPLLAIGISTLVRSSGSQRIWPIVGVIGVASVATAALRAGLADDLNAPSFWNVVSLPVRTSLLGSASLLAAGAVACICVVALILVARRYPVAVAPLLLLMFVPTVALGERSLRQRSDAVYPSGWASIGKAVDNRDIDRIAYDDDQAVFDGEYTYPWFLRDAVIVHYQPPAPPPSRFLIASDDWASQTGALRAKPLWRDPVRDQTLWDLGVAPR